MTPEEAARKLEPLRPLLTRYAHALTHHRENAEDLLQETYLKAFRALQADQFRPGTNLRAWAYTIMRNTHLSSRRSGSESRVSYVEEVYPEAAGKVQEPDQGHALELREVLAILMGGSVSKNLVPAFVGVCVCEGSYEEVAEQLRIPVGTVKSRVSRARQALLAALEGREAA